MIHRIEVKSKIRDGRAVTFIKKLNSFGFKVKNASIIDVYTINKDFSKKKLIQVEEMLKNPITEETRIDSSIEIKNFDWALEIGFLPGVTDNVAHTLKEGIEDLLKTKFNKQEEVYSSCLFFIKGNFKKDNINKIALTLYNPLIQSSRIKNKEEYNKEKGMEVVTPKVKLSESQKVNTINLEIPEEKLIKIGKEGIKNPDRVRRGPLALDLPSMLVIRDYFKKEGRKPTDIELESIAQTWSEHCKHTIFAASLDKLKKGLYREYIKRATEEIRKKKSKNDICVSVFIDNSGAIEFNKDYLISDKVETHNSPSALDPFGGAITGIVGVNRDTIGFGKAAKPIINRYGFCFANPEDKKKFYRKKNKKNQMISPRKIMEGVVEGVRVGGNCSGIPTPQGFVYFDKRYKGKPLVFVGTVGLIPKKINNKKSYTKKAKAGDYIIMVGGRVGADGIHGATFSSEALDSGSPATAVQIGDPITQKKLSDAIVKEARKSDLYNSITDNGAGGLSCSVAEMAKESGGCIVDLDKVSLKYSGLSPWEIWVSESQERMTLAIPKKKWDKFKNLMRKRGVEAIMIGQFTDSKRCIVNYKNKKIMDLDMEFLHNGLPKKNLISTYTKKKYEEPKINCPNILTKTLNNMLKRLNITSFEFISNQYDHEVQGGSVIKPLQGKGRINGLATVTKPILDSKKGIVISQGLYPSYSDIDTYHMTACSIDTAIRNTIAVGANLNHLALLDNFCWCSPFEKERLGQLKESVRACYEYAIGFETPFISGKDSMFNDFSGFNEKSERIKISIPPTLLISSIGVINDVSKTVDLAVKNPNDLIYLIGDTKEEMGGSEYFAYLGEKEREEKYIGNSIPKVDIKKAKNTYKKISGAILKNLISSAISLVNGGLGVALVKKAIGGKRGLKVDLRKINSKIKRNDYLLFSESQSRLVVTIAPKNKKVFEKMMGKTSFYLIGKIRKDGKFLVKGLDGKEIINDDIQHLEKSYKETLRDY